MGKKLLLALVGVMALFAGFSMPAFADIKFCQPSMEMNIKDWGFSIRAVSRTAEWTGRKNAAEILRMQANYYSQKSSPFARNGLFPTLSFYDANLKFRIIPMLTYAKTLSGETCATVTSAVLEVDHAPVIYLASELSERSCVARSALAHQLKHDEVTRAALAELEKKSEKFKPEIFAVYKDSGAAGRSMSELREGLGKLEQEATKSVAQAFSKYLRGNRISIVENPNNLSALAESCQGTFKEYVGLAKK